MRLLWVQQWAVLPVIVENRDMVEQNVQGGGLPPGSQTVEPLARTRLEDRERPTQTRGFPILHFFILSPSLCCHLHHFFFPQDLIIKQTMFPPGMFPMSSRCRWQLLSSKSRVANLSVHRDNRPQATT